MKLYIDLHLSPVAAKNVVFFSNRPTQGGLEETDQSRGKTSELQGKGAVVAVFRPAGSCIKCI